MLCGEDVYYTFPDITEEGAFGVVVVSHFTLHRQPVSVLSLLFCFFVPLWAWAFLRNSILGVPLNPELPLEASMYRIILLMRRPLSLLHWVGCESRGACM